MVTADSDSQAFTFDEGVVARRKSKGVPSPRRRPKPGGRFKRPLTIPQILAWADAHHQRTGIWPSERSGAVYGSPGHNWRAVNYALNRGSRGLPGGSTLARLLAEHFGISSRPRKPLLAVEQILAWADAHRTRTGKWPAVGSGPVSEAPHETWFRINSSLIQGCRGFSGGSSLARFLAEHRGAIARRPRSRLTVKQILFWVDAHHRRTGTWPTSKSGPVYETPGEIWSNISRALYLGLRGLPGGSSLHRLMVKRRGVIGALSIHRILAWAEEHCRRTGSRPTANSGAVDGAIGLTWKAIDAALRRGYRGFAGGSSLFKLLNKSDMPRPPCLRRLAPPELKIDQILAWASAFRERTGKRPTGNSGSVDDPHVKTWRAIDLALRWGRHGLPGGSSLSKLLNESGMSRWLRPRVKKPGRPKLTIHQILVWADAYRERTGKHPTAKSGAVGDVDANTWAALNGALGKGCRGLPGGSSLFKLLNESGR
jgi:hypothetical protein